MSRNGANSPAARNALLQLVVTAVCFGVISFIDLPAGISALIGGVIALVVNLVFALSVFAPYSAQDPQALVGRMYAAEIVKLVMVAVLFGAAIKFYEPLNALALFGVFFAVHMTPLLFPAGR